MHFWLSQLGVPLILGRGFGGSMMLLNITKQPLQQVITSKIVMLAVLSLRNPALRKLQFVCGGDTWCLEVETATGFDHTDMF